MCGYKMRLFFLIWLFSPQAKIINCCSLVCWSVGTVARHFWVEAGFFPIPEQTAFGLSTYYITPKEGRAEGGYVKL